MPNFCWPLTRARYLGITTVSHCSFNPNNSSWYECSQTSSLLQVKTEALEGCIAIKELPRFKSRQFFRMGVCVCVPIHKSWGLGPVWIMRSRPHKLCVSGGTRRAIERREILGRIKVEEPVGPVHPRRGQGGAPTWNATRFSRSQPGSRNLSWLPPATLMTESVVSCMGELTGGGRLPWVVYLPINTSNS